MSNFKKMKPEEGVDKRNRSLKRLSVTTTILFIAAVLIFNIVFESLLGSTLKWDWTTGEQYTIGEVSKGILGNMTADVQIIGLFEKANDQNYQDIQLMLEDYAKKSNGRITVRYVDPDQNPGITKEVDPNGYLDLTADTFVVYCPATEKAKVVTYDEIYQYEYDANYQAQLTGVSAEQSFSGAIKYVQSETTPVLYFSTGHDELDYAANYSTLVSTMQYNNYLVESLDLFDLKQIPADCEVLIMAAPEKDITTAESNVISAYLKGGGSMMVISDYSNSEFPILNKLLADYNLEISNCRLREGDIGHQFDNDAYTLRAIAPAGTLTAEVIDGFTLLDNARGINILTNASDYITTEAVLTTSAQGVAETNGDAALSSEPATQNIAVISENKGWADGSTVTESAKVMLVGSTSIFSDAILQSYGSNIYNLGLFYYGVQWLSGVSTADNLLIQAKKPVSYALTAGTQDTYNFIAIAIMVILPLLLMFAALLVYRKRKHL